MHTELKCVRCGEGGAGKEVRGGFVVAGKSKFLHCTVYDFRLYLRT